MISLHVVWVTLFVAGFSGVCIFLYPLVCRHPSFRAVRDASDKLDYYYCHLDLDEFIWSVHLICATVGLELFLDAHVYFKLFYERAIHYNWRQGSSMKELATADKR
eukprot:466201_1